MKIKFLLLLALMFSSLNFAFADEGLIMQNINYEYGNPDEFWEGFLFATKDKLKMDFFKKGDKSAVMYHSRPNEMYVVDYEDEEYFYFNEGTFKRIQKKIDDMLSKVPEGQRNLVKDMMPIGKDVLPLELKEGGKNETINTFSCRLVEAFRGDKKIADYWVASFSEVGLTQSDFAVFIKLGEFTQKFSTYLSAQNDNAYETFTKLDGFPVRTVTYVDGSPNNVSEIKSIEKNVDISKSTFLPEKDFEEKKLEFGM